MYYLQIQWKDQNQPVSFHLSAIYNTNPIGVIFVTTITCILNKAGLKNNRFKWYFRAVLIFYFLFFLENAAETLVYQFSRVQCML